MAIESDLWLSWHFICSKNRRWCMCGWRRRQTVTATVCDAFVHTHSFRKFYFKFQTISPIRQQRPLEFDNFQFIATAPIEMWNANYYQFSNSFRFGGMRSFVFKRIETRAAQCQTGKLSKWNAANEFLAECRHMCVPLRTHTSNAPSVKNGIAAYSWFRISWGGCTASNRCVSYCPRYFAHTFKWMRIMEKVNKLR